MPLGTQTISDVIRNDHRELEEYYNRIVSSHDADEQTRFQTQFIWELTRHSISEELVIHSALEMYVKDGKEMANKDREEHQTLKELICQFQRLHVEDHSFMTAIETLFTCLKRHMWEEEHKVLAKLEATLSDDKSQELAETFQRTKRLVPSWSHPSAPTKPPYETIASLLAAPMDKLMNAFTKGPED